jgi:hypothetical protein
LDGAFALRQVKSIAVLVGYDLDFNVAWLLNKLLDEKTVVAKTGLGLCRGDPEILSDLRLVPTQTYI